MDGGVSIIAGHHPKTGKFFVGYKGAIDKVGTEKEAKLAYNHEDVDRHFADKPYLQDKMKNALDHAHKILPKKGVYQGDYLFTDKEKEHHGNKVGFTPNTITYSTHKNSPEGEKINRAHMGISFHTAYDYKHGQLHSRPVESDEFRHHDDVYHLSTTNNTNRAHFKDEDKALFQHHMGKAEALNNKEIHDAVHPVGAHISTYINKTVREGTTPSTEGLKSHIGGHYDKEAAKVKTEKAKNQRESAKHELLNHIENNRGHVDNYFKMHHHLQKAKDILVHTLNNADHPLEHSIEGKKVAPEGYVFRHQKVPVKLVDRSAFSKANFAKSRD